ncbi:MAG TPA: XdhC family protein [Blastocatellia bacterium]|nr:XdhC family protein [Blastocatellia bacterium]
MLTAAEISAELKRAMEAGRSLTVVSLIELDGHPVEALSRLLVEEGGRAVGGTLGHRTLDDLGVWGAVEMMADEKQEIAVVGAGDLLTRSAIKADSDLNRDLARHPRLLFEVSRPLLEVVVCGGGHVGQAVARAARFLDFKVTVIDDRAEFVTRERLPDPEIRLVADDFLTALRSLSITPATHLVIVTRGHRHDEICLREVINRPARYIGMIGSRRRTTTIREHLRREGVAAESLHRVHAPIGLEIGAQTPEEIALAIMAEIVLIRRGGTGRPKSAEGPMARAR